MRRRKSFIAATILVSVFACANVHAEVIASRLIAFDSFVRIPFPDKVRAEIISENPAASRQLLKLSRTLKEKERSEVESALKESGHVRSVRWTGKNELTLEFRHVRAAAVEITPDLWAAVVKRPSSFPVAAVLGEEVCKGLFSKDTQADLRTQLENLCLGSREWVAKPGVYNELSRPQEYVADVLRLFTLAEMPSPETLGKWVVEPDGSVEDRLSVMILQAAALIYAGDDVAALTVLAQVDEIEHLAPELKKNIDLLGVATFERAIEVRKADDEAEAARSVWRRFNRWDSEEIDFDTKLKLADWFRANDEYDAAILQLQQLLARGFDNDLRVLEPLAETYKAAGQDYRAFATLRFIAEMH